MLFWPMLAKWLLPGVDGWFSEGSEPFDEQVVSGESPLVLLPSRLTNCLTRLFVTLPVLSCDAEREDWALLV